MTLLKRLVITIIIMAAIFTWLHKYVMPNFIAGKVSNARVTANDYIIIQVQENNSLVPLMKLERAQVGWAALQETWPVMIPILLISLPTAWYAGRMLMDNKHKIHAESHIGHNNRLVAEREKKANDKYARAEKLKADAEAIELDADRLIEKARQTLRTAESMGKSVQEQIDLANNRANEAERKLLKEREDHKKVHAQLLRYKEKAKEKPDSQIELYNNKA